MYTILDVIKVKNVSQDVNKDESDRKYEEPSEHEQIASPQRMSGEKAVTPTEEDTFDDDFGDFESGNTDNNISDESMSTKFQHELNIKETTTVVENVAKEDSSGSKKQSKETTTGSKSDYKKWGKTKGKNRKG